MSVQSVLFVHRPSNCYPLIGNCCHVRPVLPTGHSAVFFLNKGKGIGSLCPYPARREAQAHTSPDAQWESPSGGSGNAAGGMIMPPKGVQVCPPGVSLPTFSTRESRPGRRAWQSHAHAERPHKGGAQRRPPPPRIVTLG